MEQADVIIIGAGAAGLTAAIFAGRTNQSMKRRLRIVALEGARSVGAKIIVSGGSRCNVTHDVVTPDDFSGSNRNLIARVLRTFGVDATIDFFRELDIELKREETGKLFPVTDRSRDVVEALLRGVTASGVELRSNHRVTAMERDASGFRLLTSQGSFVAPRVIFATGGRSLPKSGSDGFGYELVRALGHSIRPTTPALVPLLLASGHWMTRLSGIAVDVELRVEEASGKLLRSESGSMLMTHFGLSGPVALDISRHWLAHRPARLVVNFAPQRTFEDADEWLQQSVRDSPRLTIPKLLTQRFPERLALELTAAAVVNPEIALTRISRDERRRVARTLTSLEVPVTGDRGYNFAEVTAGGVPLEEVETATMRSKKNGAVYLCGEIVDVDGRIGGYNFQWAWASGRLAGISAVTSLAEAISDSSSVDAPAEADQRSS